MKKHKLISILILFALNIFAQNKTIFYLESNEDFLNPERGFYIPVDTKASNFKALDYERLSLFRTQPQKMNRASYTVKVSLLYRAYELDIFKDKALSASFLENLKKDFDIVRASGLKLILRFAYVNQTHTGNCVDIEHICPPYGDAPKEIVLQHIAQLKPLLQQNADVIALLQQGFIGIWGENYYSDYFGDASKNGDGKILNKYWQARNEIITALLHALPKNRMIQVRTPQIKQKYVYGPEAATTSQPLNLAEAYSGSSKSRIAFHNDCFLASVDDYSTFYDLGSSTQPSQKAIEILRKFTEADTKYTAVGGETCDDAFSPQNDCEPAGYAQKELAAMHYSFLNAAYNNNVNNDWDSLGCLQNIKKNLGYRYVLQKAILPQTISKKEALNIHISLKNVGYASNFNPRPVQLVLRNTQTQTTYFLPINTQIQRWFYGNIAIKRRLKLPQNIQKGHYEVLLNLPDQYKSLQKNATYSIRLANENIWETETGFNSLNHILKVN
jgi:hypothetical protein